ncbi:hypothetical protein BDW75DRAFT_246280 [Aspergillus navahoensis]
MSSSRCTRLHNQCDECRIARSKLPGWINPSFLECPDGTYPVIFTGIYVGARTQAEQMIEIIRSCVSGLYGHDVPIHAAFRRATDSNKGIEAGPWVDITTKISQPDLWGPGALSPGIKLPGVCRKRYEKVHTKQRVVTCLVDFPHKIKKDGDMEQVIMHRLESQGFKGYTRHPESEQDQTPHASLHRLDWWVYTHPEVVREELGPSRGSKYKPGEVYIRRHAYVRKKR